MDKSIEKAWLSLAEACKENLQEKEQNEVKRAFDYAYDILEERRWKTGETIIIHFV